MTSASPLFDQPGKSFFSNDPNRIHCEISPSAGFTLKIIGSGAPRPGICVSFAHCIDVILVTGFFFFNDPKRSPCKISAGAGFTLKTIGVGAPRPVPHCHLETGKYIYFSPNDPKRSPRKISSGACSTLNIIGIGVPRPASHCRLDIIRPVTNSATRSAAIGKIGLVVTFPRKSPVLACVRNFWSRGISAVYG